MKCSVQTCNKKSHAKTFCCMHYARLTRHGDAQFINPKCNREPGNKWTKERAYNNTAKWKKRNKKTYNAYLVSRKKRIRQASPPWVNIEEIVNIYKNCPEGHQVDHIIPILNDNICGLHVPWNLQYLSEFENNSKHNRWDGTYDNKEWHRVKIIKNIKRRTHDI